MKKFKYRLEALLKMKDHIEKEKQKQLASTLRQIGDQLSKLETIEKDRESTNEVQRGAASKPFCVAEMLVISRYIHKLKRDKILGGEVLKVLRKEEEKKRIDLLEASKERKKYEKLKERQQGKYIKEIESYLAKENDEIAISNYRYKQLAAKRGR